MGELSRILAWQGPHRGRFAVALIVILLAAALAGIGTASPAYAYTCSWRSATYTHPDGVAKVSFRFGPSCSDGRSHIEGTIYDTLCDGRTAVVEFDGQRYRTQLPVGWEHFLDLTYRASNGCGSNSTFSGWALSASGASSTAWRLDSVLYAKNNNFNCCSSKYFRSMSG